MIDEKTSEQTPDSTESEFGCPSMTFRQTLADQLREMGRHVNDRDCHTLYKAAEELEESKAFGVDWAYFLFGIMAGSLFSDTKLDPDGVKAYMDAVNAKRKEGD